MIEHMSQRQKITITVQVCYFATSKSPDVTYHRPTQVEFWSDESLFEKLNKLVPVQFWFCILDDTADYSLRIKRDCPEHRKRQIIDDFQRVLIDNPRYRPALTIQDSRSNADINLERTVGLGVTEHVPHLRALLTQRNSGLQPKSTDDIHVLLTRLKAVFHTEI